MIVLAVVLALPAAYLFWSLIEMEVRYRKALKLGIPIVRQPIDPLNPLWQAFGSILWSFLLLLPFDYGSFKYSRRGWYFFDRADSFIKYGPIWGIATPTNLWLHVADVGATKHVFTHRLDYIRPWWLYKILGVFGPCLSTAKPEDWSRHRKVLASPYNERMMVTVWNETLTMSRELLERWTTAGCISFDQDVRDLTLNLLAITSFQRTLEFDDAGLSKQQAANMKGFRKSLRIVLDNILLFLVIPIDRLTYSWLPKSLRDLGHAGSEFKRYMELMVDQAFQQKKRGEGEPNTLMGSFVKAVDGSAGKTMSIEEIIGNIFVVNFAGYDTTSNTLAFMLLLLGIYPEIQEWISEELAEVFPNAKAEWTYTNYAKLVRSQAVLVRILMPKHDGANNRQLETLRLYTPFSQIPKWTGDQVQVLRVAGSDITIPPNTGVMLSPLAMHTLPQNWTRPLEWLPKRWVLQDGASERLIDPKPGTYFPWSDGPQNCIGEKFSKVEAVAALSCWFREHKIQLVPDSGESDEHLLQRAKDTLMDCDLTLLARMKHADKIKVEWLQRK